VLADPMQTDLRADYQQGAFEKLEKIFSDEDSINMGIYNFNFTDEDIMRSELVKFIVQKINQEEADNE
jgi:phosphate starvation-inducible protein PhoH